MQITRKKLREQAFNSIKGEMLVVTGFFGAHVCGIGAAASVPLFPTIFAAPIVGGVLLAVPYFMIEATLEHYKLMTPLINNILKCAFYAGSVAVGATLLAHTIPPLLILTGMVLGLYRLFYLWDCWSSDKATKTLATASPIDAGVNSLGSTSAAHGIFKATQVVSSTIVEEIDASPALA